MDYADVMRAIGSGDLDDKLEDINRVLQIRRKAIRESEEAMQYSSVQIGERVMLGNGVKPKYLNGVLATVVAKTDGKIVVHLDENIGKYRAGRDVGCPPSIIVRRSS